MNEDRSGGAPDGSSGSWATEALPMSVRKELLERELRKLGFRKMGGVGAAALESFAGDDVGSNSSHPQAGDGDGESHGG